MEVYRVSGTYTQSGDEERFKGELGIQDQVLKGQIDDLDQGMVSTPQNPDLRNKVVEGQAYPESNALYFVKREFAHALRNVERREEDEIAPQEVHVLAQNSEEGIQGEYNGIWTINRPGELPLEYLGEENFELGWQIDPEQYETHDREAEEVIDQLYDGQLPENPQDINTEQEISRGTTNFHLDLLESQERAEKDLPLDVINVALSGGVDSDRRVT